MRKNAQTCSAALLVCAFAMTAALSAMGVDPPPQSVDFNGTVSSVSAEIR